MSRFPVLVIAVFALVARATLKSSRGIVMSGITVYLPIVSAVIAVFALLVSVVHFYFDHFRNRVKLRLIYQGATNEVRDGFDCRLEYQLCNIGNVGLRLKEVDFVMRPSGAADPWPHGQRFYRCERELPAEIPAGDLELELSLMTDVVCAGVRRGGRFVVEFQLCSVRGDCYKVTHDVTALADGGELDRGPLPVMKVMEIV